jgi:hypothetical protein
VLPVVQVPMEAHLNDLPPQDGHFSDGFLQETLLQERA